jgi:Cu-processing system permease protein
MSDEMVEMELSPEVSAAPEQATQRPARIAAADWREPGILRTVLLIARVTFREAARRKILWIAAIAGAAFLALFWTGLHAAVHSMESNQSPIQRHEGIGMMTMMVLYAGSMMTSLMAALTSCDTLSGEISSGTIHAIATKPVRRWCLVLGKWLGFAVMFGLYVLFIEGGTMLISRMQGDYQAPHAGQVLALIFLEALILLSVTMAASTRFSALTSGACTLGLYGMAFVGGWIEQVGALRHIRGCVDLGIIASLIMPSDAVWRRAAYRVQPPLLGAAGVSPFSTATTPSMAMIVYAMLYTLAALMVAQILFERRDL